MRCLPLIFVVWAASCVSSPLPAPQETGDMEFANSCAAGRIAFDNGDFSRAQTLYNRGLTRARAVNGADSIVDAACNLAICEIALRHYQAADVLLREAEYDALRASAKSGEVQVLRAKVAYLLGHLAESADLAAKVIDSRADEDQRLAASILKGQILCDTGNLPAARAQLQRVEKLAGTFRSLPPSTTADVIKFRGTILRMEGSYEAAARLFDGEADLLRSTRRYGDMSHALARAAGCYLKAGKPALAADRFFLAGRSIGAQGDAAVACQWLAAGMAAAEKAGDAAARARVAALLEEWVATSEK
jgi:tetratricopeptide (TPR) repeat protein